MFWEIPIIFVLILLNGIFAMSEMALVSARRIRLKRLAESGRFGARKALEMAAEPTRLLSTVQIGITLIGTLAGAFGGATLADRLGAWLDGFPMVAGSGHEIALAIIVVVISYVSLIVGELVPKRIALTNPEVIAATLAPPMHALSRVASPVVWLLTVSSEGLLRLFGIRMERSAAVTEEEVKALVAEGASTGVFDPVEREMIDGVLRLADRTVRAIMTPRPDVVWVNADDDMETIRREIAGSGYSRFPVSRGTVDNLLGIVQTKDLLDRLLAGQPFDLMSCLKDPLVVHDGTPVLKLLNVFKGSALHLAVVVDEYGSFEGLVTLTDVIEAIAGDVSVVHAADDSYELVQREDGSWLIDGMVSIDDVERQLGLPGMREEGDYQTLAGFLLWRLGHVPKAAEVLDWAGWRFEVVDMDGRRIDKVLAKRLD